ncbi:MAG TPA: hypothetical protein VE309_02455 [Caulobacteraceae bacterium]|jgi:hypothetical protein|nr:hypothetical protein [Caulobacteraceae bacterium]
MAVFDYLTLTLARGPAARAGFVKAIAASGLSDGGKAVGLFTPQLGWEAARAALLVERGGDRVGAAEALKALSRAPEVKSCAFHELAATIRPGPGAALKAGGVYVHRWFEVETAAFDEFIALSAEAWPDFESRFDARIFGLFDLTSGRAGDPPGRRHLLLVTRYASHGVWEDSRDPSTAAMQTFARRAMLTLSTTGASTLLTLP